MSFLKVMAQISLIITEEGGMVLFVSSSGSFGANSVLEEDEPSLILANPRTSFSTSSALKPLLFPKLKVSRLEF